MADESPPGLRINRMRRPQPPPDEAASELEVTARFTALAEQRDRALLDSVMKAGRIAVLEAELAHARDQLSVAQPQPPAPPRRPRAGKGPNGTHAGPQPQS